jgi:hypothetical protein
MQILGRPALQVEFDGAYSKRGAPKPLPGHKLLGAILDHEGRTVTVKMVGPADVVKAQRESFLEFCRSLRPTSAAGAEPAGREGGLAWNAPEGWKQGPKKSMRAVTFSPSDDPAAECYIAVLGGRAGGVSANINRWLQQMGKPALSNEAIDALPEVTVLGKACRLVEAAGKFGGMGGDQREGFMLLGVVCELPQASVFVKMTGPEKIVRRERDNFIRFCESIRR